MAYGEPVHHIMQFDPADPGYLYLMTSHQVRPVPWPDQVPGPAEPSCLPGSARIAAPASSPARWPAHRSPPSEATTSAGKPCFPLRH